MLRNPPERVPESAVEAIRRDHIGGRESPDDPLDPDGALGDHRGGERRRDEEWGGGSAGERVISLRCAMG
jgi:hypothetical protein